MGVQGGWGWAERDDNTQSEREDNCYHGCASCLVFGVQVEIKKKRERERDWKMKGMTVIRPGTWKPRFLRHPYPCSELHL